MIRIKNFHSNIQLLIQYLSNSKTSCQDIANELGITKQAAHKRIKDAANFLMNYGQNGDSQCLGELRQENERLKEEIMGISKQSDISVLKGLINVYLLKNQRCAFLVDTGYANSASRVINFLRNNFVLPVTLLVL